MYATYSLFFLVFVNLSTALGCKERDVQVIFEGGDPDFMLDGFLFRSFLLDGSKCSWRTSSVSIMDSAKILIKDAFTLWPTVDNGRTARENLVQELKDIYSRNGDDIHPRDNSPIIVLFLQDKDLDVNDVVTAARDLQEVGFKFIVYGIGDKWKKVKGILQPIASAQSRVLLEKKLNDVKKSVLGTLLNNPEHEFPRLSLFSSVEASEKCDVIVDLGFILDSSWSLANNYQQEKDFIKKVAKNFNIKKGGSHAGVVTFSNMADLSIQLSSTEDLSTFEDSVDKIPLMGSNTRIDMALEKARDELFNAAYGARPGVKKVLILLTDGEQTKDLDAKDPAELAKDIRTKLDVELIVIGIGSQTNDDELKKITGPNDNFRKANDFKELSSFDFSEKMSKKVCDTASADKCKDKLVDICFLIDSSGSIDERSHWITIKHFVRTLADRFSISETGAHGAVVVFSDFIKDNKAFTKVVLRLDNKLDATDFGEKVIGIPYIGYRTRMDLGFKLVEEEVFVAKNGARANNVKRIIILITDGKQNPARYDPIAASQKLYDDGVNIYAVGIGNGVNMAQLERITRHSHRVFPAHNFNSLANKVFVKNVTKTTCHSGTLPTPPPTVKKEIAKI